MGEGFRGVGPYGVAVEFREETAEALVTRLLAKTDTVTPWAIRAAVTLRLPDLLAGEALSAARAAERVGADADALHRLLRLLSRHGVPDGRFLGTVLSEALREGHASGLVSSLDLGSAQARIDEVSRGILHRRTGLTSASSGSRWVRTSPPTGAVGVLPGVDEQQDEAAGPLARRGLRLERRPGHPAGRTPGERARAARDPAGAARHGGGSGA
ncbi:methyltransferase family protein [Streptomyces niveiscabiei]